MLTEPTAINCPCRSVVWTSFAWTLQRVLLVVVELKRGRSADRVIGQVARYMGWVRAHIATHGQDVEGIVVVHEHDDRLRYAAASVPGLTILTYQITFRLSPMPNRGGALGARRAAHRHRRRGS